ncbi:MAG: hypothetical protein E7329_05250 [Clostridiales bacterium]|nr:hypothetical protein [Clostridiales bacterium]
MEDALGRRFEELANRAWNQGSYTFTNFLDLPSLSIFHRMLPSLPPVPYRLFGGTEGCERQMLRFGDESLCGYEMPFPITCLHFTPANARFADALTHRDFLGAAMGLGIERELIGDIIVRENEAYLFCVERIASYLSDRLTQAKRTTLRCAPVVQLPEGPLYQTKRTLVQLSSPRIDALIAHVHHLSRGDAQALFPAGKVYVNGRLCESPGYSPKENEIISVRGFGRMRFIGVESLSKKGKSNTAVDLYV